MVVECNECKAPHCTSCRRLHEGKGHRCYGPPIHEDPLIRERIEAGQMQQCPKCYSVVEKVQEECWFVFCKSEEGKTCFCFRCGSQLDTAGDEHFDHFPKHPYEYTCLGRD